MKRTLFGLLIAAMAMGMAQGTSIYVAPPGIPLPGARPQAGGACKELLERVVKLGIKPAETASCLAFSRSRGESLVTQLAAQWGITLAATPLRLLSVAEQEGLFIAYFVDTLNPSIRVYLVSSETAPGLAQVAIWSSPAGSR